MARKQRNRNLEPELTLRQFVALAPFDSRLTVEQRQLFAEHVFDLLKNPGPLGYPIGFLENGEKVEWMPSVPIRSSDSAELCVPVTRLRNRREIEDTIEEFRLMIRCSFHRATLLKDERAKRKMKAAKRKAIEKDVVEIEKRLGPLNVGLGELDWAVLIGKLSALRWVEGGGWDDLDLDH